MNTHAWMGVHPCPPTHTLAPQHTRRGDTTAYVCMTVAKMLKVHA